MEIELSTEGNLVAQAIIYTLYLWRARRGTESRLLMFLTHDSKIYSSCGVWIIDSQWSCPPDYINNDLCAAIVANTSLLQHIFQRSCRVWLTHCRWEYRFPFFLPDRLDTNYCLFFLNLNLNTTMLLWQRSMWSLNALSLPSYYLASVHSTFLIHYFHWVLGVEKLASFEDLVWH